MRATRGREGVPRSAVARDGYQGPTREGKKMYAGGGSTRADKKAGKKYFGGSEGAGEKKNIFGRERKKNIIRAGAKKNSDVNENTTHKKTFTYSRAVFFPPIPLRSRYLQEGAATERFFF